MLKYLRKREGDLQINTTVGDASEAAIPYVPSRTMSSISPDWGVLFVVFSLVLIGTLMVFSASISLSDSPKYKVAIDAFLNKHLISLAVAVFVALTVSMIPMKTWKRFSPLIFLFGFILLIAVLIPGIGKNVNGSYRWIQIGPFQLQATEFMKVAALLYAATLLSASRILCTASKKGFCRWVS